MRVQVINDRREPERWRTVAEKASLYDENSAIVGAPPRISVRRPPLAPPATAFTLLGELFGAPLARRALARSTRRTLLPA
jgi:hypothetical protein